MTVQKLPGSSFLRGAKEGERERERERERQTDIQTEREREDRSGGVSEMSEKMRQVRRAAVNNKRQGSTDTDTCRGDEGGGIARKRMVMRERERQRDRDRETERQRERERERQREREDILLHGSDRLLSTSRAIVDIMRVKTVATLFMLQLDQTSICDGGMFYMVSRERGKYKGGEGGGGGGG